VDVGARDGIADIVDVGIGEGKGVGEDVSAGGASVDVPVAGGAGVSGKTVTVAAAAGRVIVLVAAGTNAATNACSCIPRATATNRVSAMRAAAISPLHSGPSPLPTSSGPSIDSQPSPDPKLTSPQNSAARSENVLALPTPQSPLPADQGAPPRHLPAKQS
jgi:hypothetical protein